MTDELMPVRCGCGGEAEVFGYDTLSGHHDYYVSCTKCGICIPTKPTEAKAISREALCEYALNTIDKTVSPNDIMRFPSAEPEREKGEWIENHTTCSECGWQMIDDVLESPNMVFFKYCPNCGARIEED